MATTGFYVDGFNLYHAVRDLGRPELKWLSLKALASSFLREGDQLVRTCYFTAVLLHDQTKSKRHERYIEALKATGVEVIRSNFLRASKFCKTQAQYCKFQEEKQTDVALATTYLLDAMKGVVDKVILVTADSDQIPAVKVIRAQCPSIELELVAPPGRRKNARELGAHFSGSRKELTAGRLAGCLLPRTVYKDDGRVAATCPVSWLPIESAPAQSPIEEISLVADDR